MKRLLISLLDGGMDGLMTRFYVQTIFQLYQDDGVIIKAVCKETPFTVEKIYVSCSNRTGTARSGPTGLPHLLWKCARLP